MPFFIYDFLFLSQFLNVINAITMDFQDILNASIQELKDDTDITDVTLACDDHSIKAHKVILSACTPWFENLDKWLYQREKRNFWNQWQSLISTQQRWANSFLKTEYEYK